MPQDEWEGLPDEDTEPLTVPLTVPVTDKVPLDEADCVTLALRESVPDTEVQPEGVAETEPVEE